VSYCRWSSDDYQSDLYIYESTTGYEVHIAGRRILYSKKLPDWVPFTPENIQNGTWQQRQEEVEKLLYSSEKQDIEFKHAGKCYTFPDGKSCADFVKELISLGYNVPNGVVEALIESDKEE
jgi:hypothetical protein